jgi:transcription initiation factor IIE alpha subunit
MIQTTSLFAYKEIQPELPRRQKQVRDELALHADMTNEELSRALNIGINKITPRVLELRKAGIVSFSQLRECRVTGYRANAWKVTNKY